jgi:hypothetical protein
VKKERNVVKDVAIDGEKRKKERKKTTNISYKGSKMNVKEEIKNNKLKNCVTNFMYRLYLLTHRIPPIGHCLQ